MDNNNNSNLNKNIKLENMIDNFSNMNTEIEKKTRIERKYDKYSKKFKDKFLRTPYIAEPNGTI